jgi:serine protease
LTVTVDAGASTDADGQIETYAWDFAGTPGVGVTAQHLFSDPGSYTIELTITDDDGARAVSSTTIEVDSSIATASISGTVLIAGSAAIDRDVNDRLTIAQPNNNFDEAQPIPSAVTLGGYTNVAGAGESTGNSFTDGDAQDFYQISFAGDEIIILSIAEADADLDLRLWDENRNMIDASIGVTTTESIELTAGGNYFIEVFAFSGASNYVLTIGKNNSANARTSHGFITRHRAPSRLSDPIVTGEVIFKSARKHISTVLGQQALQQLSSATGPLPGDPAPILGGYAQIAMKSQGIGGTTSQRYVPRLPAGGHIDDQLLQRYRTLLMVKALAQRDDVEYAEPNLVVQSHATPNDTFFGSQWHYPAINLPLAWDITTGSSEVVVAVVDTGVLVQHPDLEANLVAGYDFISDAERARDGDGLDPNPDDPGDLAYGGSSSFHGTHVAGTIGALSDNGSGVAGVAWDTRIMPIRALGRDGGTTFDVIQGVRWAAGLSNNANTLPVTPADIINLSLGSTFSSQSEQETFDAVRQEGIIVVASAGNESSSLPSYPAAYEGVIGVSATTITNSIASYSNFGSFVDIAAPGGSSVTDLNGDGIGDGVISTMGDDSGSIQFGYAHLSGTSMAAPHVAGVAALMKSIHPALTPAEFEAALLAGDLTDDLGAVGRDDRYGHGLINAQKAVFSAEQMANGQGTDPGPILSASSSTLNFGPFTTSLEVTLQNVGTGAITIASATASDPWVQIQSPQSADGLGAYQLTLDRSSLADGAYQATITFASDANDVELALIMQVTSLDLTADAGLHYLILVDEDRNTVVPAVLVSAIDGAYAFTINNVPHGEYRLFAGTDSDDDSLLCDAGEACGAFPTLDSPQVIAINADMAGLEFVSEFRVNLTSTTAAADVMPEQDREQVREQVREQEGIVVIKPKGTAADNPNPASTGPQSNAP